MLKIQITENGKQREIHSDGPVIKVGRDPTNDVVLQDDKASRHHCQIELQSSAILLRDLESRNGTYINGKRISIASITNGQFFSVGQAQLYVLPITQEESQINILRFTVIILLVGLTMVSAIGYYGYKSSSNKLRIAKQVEEDIELLLSRADNSAQLYAFSEAFELLTKAEQELADSPLDPFASSILKDDIDTTRNAVIRKDKEYNSYLQSGYILVGGRLVSPDEQEAAIAEQKRKEEAERAEQQRIEEETRARQLAEDQDRREAEDRERARREFDEAIKNLPPLMEKLTFSRFHATTWNLVYLSHELDKSTDEFLLNSADVLSRIRKLRYQDNSPIVINYRDEIIELMESVATRWNSYIITDKKSTTAIPLGFAVHKNEPVVIVGTVYSATLYNNVNQLMNTPKKRAAAFLQSDVLPELLAITLPRNLEKTSIRYIALVFSYGNSNFVSDKSDCSAEVLCIVVSLKDLSAFGAREISQEALVRNSMILLSSESGFVRVELELQ